MPRKSKIDLELKINLVKQVAHYQLSIPEAARKAHVNKTTFRQWLLAYSQEGIEGLYPTTRNRVYAPELKLKAVRDYLAGETVANFLSAKNMAFIHPVNYVIGLRCILLMESSHVEHFQETEAP